MIPPLRALLADDERPARKLLRELLKAHPEIKVIGEADGVLSASEFAKKEKPDVIFLDVQMPPASGFDLLPLLQPVPRIVFVTAHDAFAVKAFAVNAFDYLLKPVHPGRLAETIRRLLAPPDAPAPAQPPRGRLHPHDLVPLRDRGMLRMTRVGDIAAVQAEAAYAKIWSARQPPMLVLQGIGEWERQLPEPPFARLDRSLLINMAFIRSVDRRTRDETLLSLEGIPDPLRVGRAASLRLQRLLRR